MTRFMPSANGGFNRFMNQQEIFRDALHQVAKLCAVAAMTAPKSGGQLFLKGGTPFMETVSVSQKNIIFDEKMPEIKFPA